MRPRVHRWSRVLCTAALAVLLVFANGGSSSIAVAQSDPPPLVPLHGFIDHVSAPATGAPPMASVQSGPRSISGDGRFVVMESSASDLVADDFNGNPDIFLRDRQAGRMSRVSVGFDGSESNGMSQGPSISTNGRHVVFMSGASNLVPGDTNNVWDIFVRDLDRGRTVRVSVASGGTETDADSYWPAISADGRFVAFTSGASTLAPGAVLYGPMQAYIHDRDADGNGVFDEPGATTTSLVSVSVTGGFADGHVDGVRVSADGRFVLFDSQATNLDAIGNPDQRPHLYRRDRQTGETILVDRAVTGAPSNWGISWRSADMSDDGRFVTYASMSNDIVPFELNYTLQVYRYDAAADPASATVMVSALPDGTIGAGSAFATSVSADGRYVAFTTTATNLVTPPASQTAGAVAVRDMADGTFTRVDVVEGGIPFDHTYGYSPALSADGSALAFQSSATNAVGGMNTWNADHVFVVTAFSASATSIAAPVAGSVGSIEVNTTGVSGWNAVSLDPWIVLTAGDGFGAGPRTVQYLVNANDGGIVRDGRVRLGSTTVTVHQEGDGDPTPPVIESIVTGTLGGDGWYVGPVTVQFTVTDPESAIVNQSYGCAGVTFSGDALYAPVTCEATSHGGTSSKMVVIRIDNTAPAITISTPAATIYGANTVVPVSFTCNDANGYSGVATCAITDGSSPLDTTPGRHRFSVTATDRAGNSRTRSVDYLVGTGVCVPPLDTIKAWWRFDGTTLDQLMNFYGDPMPFSQQYFAPGVAGQSWQAQATSYLVTHDGGRLLAADALTIAAWLKPAGQIGESGTIVSKPSQYRVARYPDGTLRWAFNQDGVFEWINTGLVIASGVWTHVAVVYDHGVVNTYVNGRLAHSYELTGTLSAGPDPIAPMTIGGRADASASYFGWLDELQVFDAALGAPEVESIALAGSGSLCLPKPTTITIALPSSVPFAPAFQAAATLTDADGNPVAGKVINFTAYLSAGGNYSGWATGTTDSAGQIQVQLPIASDAPAGTYPWGVVAQYSGDIHYASASTTAAVTLAKGTPAIAWTTPASIVYGTALGAAQLNAATETAGTFTYSPPPGTFLDAGTHVLSATFTPAEGDRWNTVTATTTIVVHKAAPVVTVTGGTFTYDKEPHPGIARATGVFGEALSPVQVFYNNTSQTPPVNAGANWVSASYEGSTNYTSGFASNVPLVITRAVPTVTITGGPFTFDGRPHQATVTVRGVGEDTLSPFGVTYDGGSSLPVQAGSHTVTVAYDGDGNYEAATVEGPLVINKATPIMSLDDIAITYDGQPHGVNVNVAGVAGDWLTPVVVTYNGSTTTPADAGTYTMEARYDGSSNYNPISRTATLKILKATPYLTWRNPASVFYGTPLGGDQLNAAANVPGSFAYTPGAGEVLNAGTHPLTAVFTPADPVNYESKSVSASLTVDRVYARFAWSRPQDIVYGTPLGDAQLNATANVPGAFSYSPAAGTVLNAGEHILSATFTPDDPANYVGGSAGASLTVVKASPTIAWATPADIVYGTRLNTVQLNAMANVLGTYTYSPSLDTVLSAGTHTLAVTFTPDDAANYSDAAATVTINVAKAVPWIAWDAPAGIVYGTPLSAAQLNATANVAGTFTYSPPPGSVLNAGTQALRVTFTPDDTANYLGAEATVTMTVAKAATALVWAAPSSIVYGTPLSAAQLNATANVPGTFSYWPLPGTVLNAGVQTLTATFTPDDAANYVGAEASVAVNVAKAATSIVWATPADIVYGTALTAAQLNATANVPGTFSYSPSPGTRLSAGTQPLMVSFTPTDSANYFGSTATTIVTVRQAPLAVAANATTKVFGAPLPSFSASASGFVNGDTLASLTGALSFTTAATAASAVGEYAVTPQGVSSPNYAIAFVPGTLTIVPASTTTVVALSANPAGYNQPVTFTASIAVVAPGAGAPTGVVQFFDGGRLLGTAPLVGAAATLTTNGLATGSHTISATYSGDASFAASAGDGVLTVKSSYYSSSTTVTSTDSATQIGQSVTLIASISAQTSVSGTVAFYDGSVLLGTATVWDKQARYTTSALTPGGHAITAVYLGNGSTPPSTSPVFAQYVQLSNDKTRTSTLMLSASPSSASLGASVTFTATVSGSYRESITGQVLFLVDGVVVGSRAVTQISGSTARTAFTISTLPRGTHRVEAVYLGDDDYRADAASVTLVVN